MFGGALGVVPRLAVREDPAIATCLRLKMKGGKRGGDERRHDERRQERRREAVPQQQCHDERR